jgi:acetylornithine deacetylase/succinyl-diaminopimelate desuccinylase-like protein
MALTQLKINGDRLNSTLQDTCSQWGAMSTGTGMCRLTLTAEDKEVRDWLVEECRGLGCDIKIDQMGNVFATRPGIAKDRNAIAMGSHMDTQPAGGRCA